MYIEYVDIFNLCALLAILFAGALLFFVCGYALADMKHSRKLGIEDVGLGGVYPKPGTINGKINKEVKSSLKVKTKKEEQEDDREQTVFFS